MFNCSITMVSMKCLQKKERMMRFQKSHMQIHEAYQFLHKKRTAQVTVAKRQKLLLSNFCIYPSKVQA